MFGLYPTSLALIHEDIMLAQICRTRIMALDETPTAMSLAQGIDGGTRKWILRRAGSWTTLHEALRL